MTIIKVALFFIFLNEKNEKDSVDFWHRKMTLKVRILLFSTFNSKTTQRPKIFLWLFSQFFGLAYLPLNSAACRIIPLGTLTKQSCAGSLAEIGDTHENSDVVRQIDKPTTKKNKKKFWAFIFSTRYRTKQCMIARCHGAMPYIVYFTTFG